MASEYGPAVEPTTRQLRYVSVSAITAADPSLDGGCKRRWFRKYVLREPEPERTFHKRGTDGHAQAEHYLKTGEDVLGPMMRAGKHLLPPPAPALPGLYVEQKLDLFGLTAAGVPLIGRMDWFHHHGWYISPDGLALTDPPGTVEVGDLKTSSNVEKYAKKGADLIKTVQMPGYAAAILKALPQAEFFRLSHVTFSTDTSRKWHAAKSTELFPVSEITAAWRRVEGVVEEMKHIAKQDIAMEVEGNESACASFGGCPHWEACHQHLTPVEKLRMSLMTKVRQQTGAPQTQQPANGAFQPPAAFAAPPMVGPPAIPAGQPYVQQPQQPQFQAPQFQPVQQPGGPAPQFQQPQPPQQQYQQPQVPAQPQFQAPPAVFQPQQLQQQVQQQAVQNFVPQQAQQPQAPFVPQQQAPAAPFVPQQPAQALQGPPTQQFQAPPTQQAATPTAGKRGGRKPKATDPALQAQPQVGGLRLYINCIPNGPYALLDGYVQELLGAIEEQFQVPDVRCAQDGNSPLAFGRWRGVLTSAIRAGLPADGAYVVFTGNELTDAVIDALSPLCPVGAVVKGVR